MSRTKAVVKKLQTLYLGEICTLYLKDMQIITVDENQAEVKINVMLDGLVLDIDGDYVHLGNEDGVITKSIPHDLIGIIEIAFVGGEIMDMDVPLDGDVH